MKLYAPIVLAVLTGVITLLAYFVPALSGVQQVLLSWAALLAAIALIVGVIGLIRLHSNRVLFGLPNWGYSGVLLLGMFLMLTLYVVALTASFVPDSKEMLELHGFVASILQFIFDYVQTPLEAAMGALLAFILVLAGVRLIRVRRNGPALAFIIFSFFFASCALFSPENYRSLITQTWAVGGARGLLLGMGLGIVATGLRVLMAADRPYGE